MLLTDFTYRIVLPPCDASAHFVNTVAELGQDISKVMPYLNATIEKARYLPEANILRFGWEGCAVTLRPREIAITKLGSKDEAPEALEEIKDLINSTWERREEIEPSYKRGDEIKFIEVFKLLPGTNCRECGQPTCLAFATKLAKDEVELDACSPLLLEEHAEKRAKLVDMLEASGYL